MLIIIEKVLISFIIVYSIYMIYFYFRNNCKKKKNSLIEVQYLKKVYNINFELISRDKVEKDIAIINSIIITIDLFIYFNIVSVALSLIIIFFVTFVLIAIFYTILGNIYRKYR